MFAVKWEFSMAPSRPDPTSAGMTKWVLRLYCRTIFLLASLPSSPPARAAYVLPANISRCC